jgi:hypothetical protein
MPHSGDHNPPKFPVSGDTREISEASHNIHFCPSMMITMIRRTRLGRAALCSGFPGAKADRAAGDGRPLAAGNPPH